jgi:hypothetical protein
VAQKAVDPVNTSVANLPIEEGAIQNAERVQTPPEFQRHVTLPHTVSQKV